MIKRFFDIASQIVLLWLVFRLGTLLVNLLHLSLPGNVAGMLIMFVLLASGLVKPARIEAGGGFLLKHFAFFFIPISVGLMTFGGLMAEKGLALLAILTGSAVAGVLLTGLFVQAMHGRGER